MRSQRERDDVQTLIWMVSAHLRDVAVAVQTILATACHELPDSDFRRKSTETDGPTISPDPKYPREAVSLRRLDPVRPISSPSAQDKNRSQRSEYQKHESEEACRFQWP